LIAASSASALSTIAFAENRAPERDKRSNWPLAFSASAPSTSATSTGYVTRQAQTVEDGSNGRGFSGMH
jgi:hypothetical protein